MNANVRAVPEALRTWLAAHPRFVLAFSGGCDSAYLFYAASACGADFAACYVQSPFQPEFELEDAMRLAEELSREIDVLPLDVLADEQLCANPPDRCYHCKRRIFSAICARAAAKGYGLVIDGTNASDDAGDRPGMRALRELEVASPLRLCGLTKARVRELSREAELFTWNKPAYACLATRIPAGTPIDGETLVKVERAEAALAQLGFSDFRARLTQRGVRLELTEADMARLMERRAEVCAALEKDFGEIALDLHPRRGLEAEITSQDTEYRGK